MKDKVSLIQLFLTFAKIGVMTFGGGMAMLPMLIKEIDEKHGWATSEELADYFAIGQCTPGIIAVNTATFVGQKKRGALGGIAATLGVVFPSLVIIITLAGVISLFADNLYVQKAFAGVRVCVCVLVLNTAFKLRKSAIIDKVTFIIFLTAVFFAVLLKVSSVYIVIYALILGIGYHLLGFGTKEDEK